MKRIGRVLLRHGLLIVAFGAEVLLVVVLHRMGTTGLAAMMVALVLAWALWNARATWRLVRADVSGSKLAQGALIWLVPIFGAALIEDLIRNDPWEGPREEVDYEALEDMSGPVLWLDETAEVGGPEAIVADD